MRRYRTKRDANHQEIVDTLRAAGCSVVDLAAVGGGVPDLLVGWDGHNTLMEVKNPAHIKIGGAAMTKTRQRQAEFREKWRGRVAVVYSRDEALRALSPSTDPS